MKVLFLSRGPSPYRVDFFTELGKLCDLTVLFELKPEEIGDRNITWFRNQYLNFNAVFLKKMFRVKRDNFCPEVVKFLDKSIYDFIIVGMYSTPTQMYAINYMKRKGIAYALNSDGGFIKKDSFLGKAIKRYLISGAEMYFSSSKSTSEYLRYYGAGDKIVVYPFTTTLKSKMPLKQVVPNEKAGIRSDIGIPKDSFTILGVGQFIYRKGFDVLIKSAKYLTGDYEIYVVGGHETEEYAELRAGNPHIHFVEFKTGDELSNFYKAADVFVLPTREDIWGLVINEAMSYGLPVITTSKCLAGIELVKDGENGYIIPSESPSILGEKLMQLLTNKSLCDMMGRKSFDRIKYFTIENMAMVHYEAMDQYRSIPVIQK